ncbi:MAG: radical SAM protein [Clostridia bacterium]|nr:radical SAM protein [Clostridia bacterium]
MGLPGNALEWLEDYRKKGGAPFKEHKELMRFWDFKAREKGIPISGQFELTPLCNFDCKMCYVHLTKDQLNARPLLTTEEWKSIMHQAWEAGMIGAILTGGECLTYPGFRDIYLYLHSLGVMVTILTNGYLLDEEWIRFFQAHPPIGIYITLYGPNEEAYERVTGHRGFEKVVSHLKMLKETDLPAHVMITPNRYLGEDVFETMRFTQSLGYGLYVNPGLLSAREETGRAGQEHDVDLPFYVRIHRLVQELKGEAYSEEVIPEDQLPPAGGPHHACTETGLKCGAGRSDFFINWKGMMSPCDELYIVQRDVLKEGFQEAWRFINREVNAWPMVPECQECAYESVCRVCASKVLRCGKPGKQPLALCERMKYLVQHGVVDFPKCE